MLHLVGQYCAVFCSQLLVHIQVYNGRSGGFYSCSVRGVPIAVQIADHYKIYVGDERMKENVRAIVKANLF